MNREQARLAAWVGVSAIAALAMVVRIAAMAPTSIDGVWQGSLNTGGGSLHVIFHFAHDTDGRLTGTLDSPDQQVSNIAMTTVTYAEPDLHLTIERFGCVYDGRISQDGAEISGTWKQGTASLPLTVRRAVK